MAVLGFSKVSKESKTWCMNTFQVPASIIVDIVWPEEIMQPTLIQGEEE